MSRNYPRFSIFFIVVMVIMVIGLVLLDDDPSEGDSPQPTTSEQLHKK